MAIIRCPHCGTANREGSNFCNSCGVELRTSGANPPPQDLREQSQPDQTPAEGAQDQPTEPKQTPESTSRHPESRAGDVLESGLAMDFRPESDAGSFAENQVAGESSAVAHPLFSIPGLLRPVHISVSADEGNRRTPSSASQVEQSDLWRQVRTRMSTEPLLAGLSLAGMRLPRPDLRQRGLFIVLAIAILLPAMSVFTWPSGSATEWPGVREAFAQIDSLPANADVLVYWAYDPATAGELDLEAQPVVIHLFQQRARLSVVSLLPGGPATARRLVNRARIEWQRSEDLSITAKGSWDVPIVYLPGGPSILALIAQNRDAAFVGSAEVSSGGSSVSSAGPPDLSIVFGAQADDVQHWVEQVQPFSASPVIAVVAAGADPVVRPYFESGQVAGLVSGFDGAYSYRRLLDEEDRRDSVNQLHMELVLQDWGHLFFFLVIIMGNFAAVMRRGTPSRTLED